MDIYKDPCHPRCEGLILLETYSALSSEEIKERLPPFLTIVKEVTGESRYSMFNLSLKDTWDGNKHFCNLVGNDGKADGSKYFHNGGETEAEEGKSNRSEKFLACNDETSEKHFRANGDIDAYSSNKQNGKPNGVNGTTNGVNGKGTKA